MAARWLFLRRGAASDGFGVSAGFNLDLIGAAVAVVVVVVARSASEPPMAESTATGWAWGGACARVSAGVSLACCAGTGAQAVVGSAHFDDADACPSACGPANPEATAARRAGDTHLLCLLAALAAGPAQPTHIHSDSRAATDPSNSSSSRSRMILRAYSKAPPPAPPPQQPRMPQPATWRHTCLRLRCRSLNAWHLTCAVKARHGSVHEHAALQDISGDSAPVCRRECGSARRSCWFCSRLGRPCPRPAPPSPPLAA